MEFIHHHDLLQDHKVTFTNFIMDYLSFKIEPSCVHVVVGGDKMNYEFDVGSPDSSPFETKLIINSVISDARRSNRFVSLDLKDHFLMSPILNTERAHSFKMHSSGHHKKM